METKDVNKRCESFGEYFPLSRKLIEWKRLNERCSIAQAPFLLVGN